MKIIINSGKYLADPNNAGLQAAWSSNRCDAARMTDEAAAKKIAVYRMLVPGSRIAMVDADEPQSALVSL